MTEQNQGFQELMEKAKSAHHDLRLQEALEHYRVAKELQPESYQVYLGMARTLTRMRRKDEAVAAAQKCVALDPDRSEGYTALGTLHFLADDNQEALSALKHAIGLSPRDPEAHLILAQVYADLGRFEDAASELETSRDLIDAIEDEGEQQRQLAMAWHTEAYTNLAEGNKDRAQECAQQAMALQEANPHAACLAYSNMGILEARARHYDQGIEYLEHAYQMNPYFYRAGKALGRLLIVRNQPQRAVEVLSQVLEHTPFEKSSTRYAYATSLAKLKRRHEALAAYREALEEGLKGPEKLHAHWQTFFLSDWGRYMLIGIAMTALLAWITFAQPSPTALTFVAILAVILILQNTIGKRRR